MAIDAKGSCDECGGTHYGSSVCPYNPDEAKRLDEKRKELADRRESRRMIYGPTKYQKNQHGVVRNPVAPCPDCIDRTRVYASICEGCGGSGDMSNLYHEIDDNGDVGRRMVFVVSEFRGGEMQPIAVCDTIEEALRRDPKGPIHAIPFDELI